MNLVKEISDLEDSNNKSNFRLREAARAILIDEDQKIPLLYVSKYEYHKLPGGGIDEGETKEEALIRESLEEVGSKIEIDSEVGKVVEYRKEHNLKQVSYCYIGKIISKGAPNFTQKEIDNGFQILWLDIKEAIEKIKTDIPKDYEGKFIQERDLALLNRANEIITSNS